MTKLKAKSKTSSLVLIAAMVSACATGGGKYQLELMPAPVIYTDGRINPFFDDEAIGQYGRPTMLYATDRAPALPDDGRYEHYTNQRGHLLRLGMAEIGISYDLSTNWPDARTNSLAADRAENITLEVTSVSEFGPLARTIRPFDEWIDASDEPGERFIAEIDRRLAATASKDVYIYVPGYKVNFENPLAVATELWHFLGYNGAAVAFSWPTTVKRLAYVGDLENAMASARTLRMLVVYIAEESQAERIHVIGYSAGTRLVSRMLADFGILGYGRSDQEIREKTKLGHVILTGSDIDRAVLGGYLLDGALRVPESLTIYASRTDKALGVSKVMLGKYRSGQLNDIAPPGESSRGFFESTSALRVIDVTDAQGSQTGNGHAYFRFSPFVSSDILMTLLYDLPPAQRGLVWSDELPVWKFPDDYQQRLREALNASRPELFGFDH